MACNIVPLGSDQRSHHPAPSFVPKRTVAMWTSTPVSRQACYLGRACLRGGFGRAYTHNHHPSPTIIPPSKTQTAVGLESNDTLKNRPKSLAAVCGWFCLLLVSVVSRRRPEFDSHFCLTRFLGKISRGPVTL